MHGNKIPLNFTKTRTRKTLRVTPLPLGPVGVGLKCEDCTAKGKDRHIPLSNWRFKCCLGNTWTDMLS